MKPGNKNSFKSLKSIKINNKDYKYFSLVEAEKNGLKGKQVIAVCNFPEKNIAGVVSQVLILGSVDSEGKVTLVHPSQKADNGLPIA